MIAALGLVLFAAVVVAVAQRLLPGAAWMRRAPRQGVVAWQIVTLTVPVSLLLAGVALALPIVPNATDDLAGLLGACEFMVRQHYETPGGLLVHLVGVAGVAALLARLVGSVIAEFASVRRDRDRQRARVALIGRPDVVPGTWIVEDNRPAVFCIPGRDHQIVVTSGALALLTPRQRVLALAHERAHLGGRHHVALTLASALSRGIPGIRLFAVAEKEIATLVEMHADDRATVSGGRRELATALVALAQGASPAGALAINGGAAIQRVHRLLVTAPGLPIGQRWSIHGIVTALVAAPVLIAAAPALETALLDYCASAFHA